MKERQVDLLGKTNEGSYRAAEAGYQKRKESHEKWHLCGLKDILLRSFPVQLHSTPGRFDTL